MTNRFSEPARLMALGALWCAVQYAVALASNFDGQPPPMASMPARVMTPPKAYRQPATFLVTTLKDPDAVIETCRRLGLTAIVRGCETNPANGGMAHVYLSNPCPEADREQVADVLCHEQGHAPPNNWPANHPLGGGAP